jgi:integrase
LIGAALRVLKRRLAESGEDKDSGAFVFPGPGQSGHLIDLKKPWTEFRKRARLEKYHIHDLRHTCASYQAIAGVSLQQIGASLGHQSMQSTEIYAHLLDQAVRTGRESGHATQLQMMKASKRRAKLDARKPKLPKLLKQAVSA